MNILRTEADHCFDCAVSKLNKTPNDPMRGICSVVIKSEACKGVKKKDLMDCENWRAGGFTNPFSLLSGCSEGLFNSAVTFLKFMWDVLKWIGRTATHPIKSGKAGAEYANSARLYLANEYDKAYDRSSSVFPGKSVKASGAVAQGVASLFVEGIRKALFESDKAFGCYNEKARTRAICEVSGEFIMPPAVALSFLKTGKVMRRDIKEIKKLKKKNPHIELITTTGKHTSNTKIIIAKGTYPKFGKVISQEGELEKMKPKMSEEKAMEILKAKNKEGVDNMKIYEKKLSQLGWSRLLVSRLKSRYSKMVTIVQDKIEAPKTKWAYHGSSTANYSSIHKIGLNSNKGQGFYKGIVRSNRPDGAFYSRDAAYAYEYAKKYGFMNLRQNQKGDKSKPILFRWETEPGYISEIRYSQRIITPKELEFSLDEGKTWYNFFENKNLPD